MKNISWTQFLLLALFLSIPVFVPVFLLWPSRTSLQTSSSPDGLHNAELIRIDHLDRNYSLWVDGERVYVSPDFAPRHDLPYREALIWDTTGKVLVLEIARHRLFGFDVSKRRPLSDKELLAVELEPDPPLKEYFFEGAWPGIGRARE